MAIEHIHGVRCGAEPLAAFVTELIERAGADAPSAAAMARAVVDASARAYDTHGIRLVPWYVQTVEGGRINRTPHVTFTRKAAAVGHVDGDDCVGHLASYRAIDEACGMARDTGVAAVTVGRSSHHGATGCYTVAAARQGFAAIGMTHADRIVVPHGGLKPFFGTNPLSFAVPVPDEEPLVLDMASSSIPFNRVLLRRATRTPLPPDIAMTAEGVPTTDPDEAASLMPLGGATFGYKGSGLAAMIDVLCSAFTGMGHGATLASFGGPDFSSPIPVGHFFLVLNPAIFQALGAFDASIAAFLADLRAQPGRPGATVMAPSDLEKGEAARRAAAGIPVDAVTWAALAAQAARLGVDMPGTLD